MTQLQTEDVFMASWWAIDKWLS